MTTEAVKPNWIEEKMLPLAMKIADQRHLKAIQAGFIMVMPLMVLGSFVLILGEPPVDYTTLAEGGLLYGLFKAWRGIADALAGIIWPVFNYTLGAISVLVCVGIAYSLAESYKTKILMAVIVAISCFFILNGTDMEGSFSPRFFDGTGLFAAMISGIVSTELFRRLVEKRVGYIKMPEGVPPALATSFETMVPAMIVVIVFGVISYFFQAVLHVTFPEAVLNVMHPIIKFIDNVVGAAFIAVVTQVLWWFGIHDTAVGAIISPIRDANFAANAAAYAAGTPISEMPYIFTAPYWWVFVTLGGSGATLALAFLLFGAKSERLRTVAKLGIVPAFFNINEPLLFGIPLILNPLFLVPFIGAQTVNAIVTYIAMSANIVNRTVIYPGWNMFAPIGAFLATLDWKAVVLIIGLIVLDGLIYLPFLRVYDKQLVAQEHASASENS